MKTIKTAKAHRIESSASDKRPSHCSQWRQKTEGRVLLPKNIFFADEKTFVLGAESREGARNFRAHMLHSVKKADFPAEFLTPCQGTRQGGVRVMVGVGVSRQGRAALPR